MNAQPDVSVIVVHYRTPTELGRCLRALAETDSGPTFETFVVDNASQGFRAADVTAVLPGSVVIENDENVGFARAANQALRRARGRYVLLLNPDAFLARDSLPLMVRYMDERPNVGCATARLVRPDGRLDLACRRSFPTPIRAFYRLTLLSRLFPRSRHFAEYNLTYLDERKEVEIDSPCGAFMLVRADVVAQVGLLDERYFMYGEDLDWAFRIKRAGWRVMYTPITTVTHVKRASSRQARSSSIRAFYDAMHIFYRAHYEPLYPRPFSWLVYAAIDVRKAIALALAFAGGGRPGG